jgi:hypothetical protein
MICRVPGNGSMLTLSAMTKLGRIQVVWTID